MQKDSIKSTTCSVNRIRRKKKYRVSHLNFLCITEHRFGVEISDFDKKLASYRTMQTCLNCRRVPTPESNYLSPYNGPMTPGPRSLSDLFLSFTWLALQGFGGVLAVVQRELVERKRWMTQEEFTGDWAVAQVMPGPNVVNLSMMIGGRYFGLPGALAALAGMLALPLVLVLLLALAHARFAHDPAVGGALRGMAAVSAGMIGAVGLKMLAALKSGPLPGWLAALAIAAGFAAVALLRLPIAPVLFGLGGLCCLAAYRRLRP
jgi:chromate transporter